MGDRDEKGRFKGNPPAGGLIHGLNLTVSPGASDLLAAFHLGFAEAVSFYEKVHGPAVIPPVVGAPDLTDEELEQDSPPRHLGPLAMAAWYQAKGIKPEFPEADNPEDHPAYKEIEKEMGVAGLGDEGPEDKR